MPHLRFEYPSNLSEIADLPAFAETLREAMIACGIFPRSGIRVRGLPCSPVAVADGGEHLFIHMELMIGTGRSDAEKEEAVAQIYGAAEDFLRPVIGQRTFALSLELRELSRFNKKSWNAIRSQIGD